MADASARGWGPGWPTDRRKDMRTVEAGGIAVLVHKDIAPIVAALLNETLAGGYYLNPKWCWGFACRAIAGTNRPSNHSWGLAVDLNAPNNPMSDRLITDMPGWMVDLWRRRGFRWGGDYSGRKDAMHFEYMGTPADAQRTVAEMNAPAIPVIKPPPPITPVYDFEELAVKSKLVCVALDDKGNGWTDWDPGFGRDPIISGLVKQGPSPPDDGGYWLEQAGADLSAQPRGGKVRVVVRCGPPGGTVCAWASVA